MSVSSIRAVPTSVHNDTSHSCRESKKIERVCGHICFDAKLGGTFVPIFILIKSAKSYVAVKMVGTRYRQYLFKSSVASFVNLFHSRIEIKVPSAENPERANILQFKAWRRSEYKMHATPAARNFCHVRSAAFQDHSPSFSPNLFPTFYLLARGTK